MKRILLLSVFALIALATQAQLFKIGRFDIGYIYVGPKIGTNFTKLSKWSYDDGYEMKNKMGFQLGVVGEFGFTNKFSIQGELLFLSRGTNKVYTGDFFGMDTKMKTTSIGIPILAKYAFKAIGLSKIYVTGGGYSTIKTGGSQVYEDGISYDDYHWRTMDWGLTFGFGGEYDAKKGIWGLDFRYDLGLVDAYRQMDESTVSQFRNFNITVTYKYDVVDLIKRLRAKRVDKKAAEAANE